MAFADAAVGPLSSPALLRTIDVPEQTADTVAVVVTDSGFLADSVFAIRYTLAISPDLRRVDRTDWAQRCQPNRGQRTFEPELCS